VESAPPAQTAVYKSVEYVNGRAVTKYSSKPLAGAERIK
jgi:hypothetical protein